MKETTEKLSTGDFGGDPKDAKVLGSEAEEARKETSGETAPPAKAKRGANS